MKSICLRVTRIYVCALLLLIPFTGVTSPRLKPPNIVLSDIDLMSISFNGAQVLITLDVHNPNNTEIFVESVRYRLTLNQTPVKSGVIRQQERFPAQARRRVNVPVSLVYDEHLPSLLAALTSPTPSHYEISGNVTLKDEATPFPFQHKGLFILPTPSSTSVINATVTLLPIAWSSNKTEDLL